ncbi:O-phosphoseryl-tRNA(Sec) selenium transferase, variant 4 [Balamuthia mandrillaris]
MPEDGWDDASIELFLHELSLMDSNNFVENVGVGEREARIASRLVAQRHYRFGHGVGRSGELAAVQPKAAGSSLIVSLTNHMTLDALKLTGLHNVKACLVLPMATGMSLALTLLALRAKRPASAKYVLWPRIDQKTCFKCILTTGLVPVVVENKLEGDEVRTDMEALEREIVERGPDSILCVLSTSSCFAPRAPDRIVEIAQLCKRYNIGHIVNNAYGLQATKSTHLISEGCRVGRVDAFVQSTDKNFMVPVGGAIVAGTDKAFIRAISTSYPGRASASPVLDLFITLLSLGRNGYSRLLKERKENFGYFTSKLSEFASEHGERLLQTPNNPISFGITLSQLEDKQPQGATMLGSMLFSRCCSGTRTVGKGAKKEIGGFTFADYGMHLEGYPTAYLSAACSIGLRKHDIDLFLQRLRKALARRQKQLASSKNEENEEEGGKVAEDKSKGGQAK